MQIQGMTLNALRVAVAACLVASVPVQAQTVGASFTGSYTVTDLGTPGGLPPRFGGLTFLDSSILLIGGAASADFSITASAPTGALGE